MTTTRCRATRRGFTLLEVLLATILLSLLLWTIYDAYIAASRTIARCQKGYSPFREGVKLQKLLSRTLCATSASKPRNPKAAFAGDETGLSLTTLSRQGADPDHPCPIAFVKISFERGSGLSIVDHPTYFLTDKEAPSKGRSVVFKLVQRLKLSYWDGSDWVREWEASKKGKLPARVRFALELAEDDGPTTPWVFETALPIQPEQPANQVPLVPGQRPGGIQQPGGMPPGGPNTPVVPPGRMAPGTGRAPAPTDPAEGGPERV